MHVSAISRTAHEHPVSLAGLGQGGQEVGPPVVLPQHITRLEVTVAPANNSVLPVTKIIRNEFNKA